MNAHSANIILTISAPEFIITQHKVEIGPDKGRSSEVSGGQALRIKILDSECPTLRAVRAPEGDRIICCLQGKDHQAGRNTHEVAKVGAFHTGSDFLNKGCADRSSVAGIKLIAQASVGIGREYDSIGQCRVSNCDGDRRQIGDLGVIAGVIDVTNKFWIA